MRMNRNYCTPHKMFHRREAHHAREGYVVLTCNPKVTMSAVQNVARYLALFCLALLPAQLCCWEAFAKDEPQQSTDPVEFQVDCREPGVLVRVLGLMDRTGRLRAEVFSDRQEEFLASRKLLESSGRFFMRIDFDIPKSGVPQVCVQLSDPGRYSMAVLHDRNADGKLNVFSDGFGFPNNPKLGMDKPSVNQAIFVSGPGHAPIEIVLNYWNGLGASPIKKKKWK